MKITDKSSIRKILIITLSNIGDAILTLPVFFVLRREFPGADIYAMVGERAARIFGGDPRIKKVLIYDKKSPLIDKIRLGFKLRKEKFGLVVDLRNTLYPLFIGAKYRTSLFNPNFAHLRSRQAKFAPKGSFGKSDEDLPILRGNPGFFDRTILCGCKIWDTLQNRPNSRRVWSCSPSLSLGADFSNEKSGIKPAAERPHKKYVHLSKLKQFRVNIENAEFSLWIDADSQNYADRLLKESGIKDGDKFVLIAPGGRSHIKRWRPEGFAEVAERLIEEGRKKVVFVGDGKDGEIINKIIGLMKNGAVNLAGQPAFSLAGKTDIIQSAAVVGRSALVITNDSATLHIASAVNAPTVAIFGPTDPAKYGPLSSKSVVIKKGLSCSPCEKALCDKDLECMILLDADEVYRACEKLL